MTLPRQVLPDCFYMLTRRCTQRQFLLRPDEELNNAFLYCLIEAAIRFDIGLIQSTALSNHHHTNIHDRTGTVCEFMEHFHKMLAKCVNHMRGRSENCWASEPASAVELLEPQDVLNKVVYAATNPVKDGLVEFVSEWPGVNTIDALLEGRVLRARRPSYFRDDGTMPAEVSIMQELPPQLGELQAMLDALRTRIARAESRWLLIRSVLGRSVLGRDRVRKQSWRSSPDSNANRGGLRPRIAARSKWVRIGRLDEKACFHAEYREARRAMLAGTPIPFPRGTYWLRRFAGVEIAASPLN